MSGNRSGAAVGFTFFASLMMIMVGVFDMIQGFAAIVKQSFFVATPNYVFKFNVTTWGWINLLLGLVILLAGVGLLRGAVWARTVGVIMAVAVAIGSFAWLPYYPAGAIVVIVICVFVMWALTVHGRDIAEE